MRILVCNIGSSSLKFQLLEMPAEKCVARGHIERVGNPPSELKFWLGDRLIRQELAAVTNHRAAVSRVLDLLCRRTSASSAEALGLQAIGFKCVQAGEKNGSVILDSSVLQAMEEYRDLAPAHNPPYLEAIRMFQQLIPLVPLVGVFEPGYHVEAPEYAKVYGTPWDWIEQHGVRRYGYHGASHHFVASETIRILNLPPERHRIVSCHLGGSSSVCAIRDGLAIDTSMGFSPQSGLIQGARTGDLDPFVLPHIMRRKGISLEEALEECSSKGGLAGLSGTSGDMRDIQLAIEKGSTRARLARDKLIYDIRRYIGSYLVLLEGVDAITFTGGIGQRDFSLREEVLSSLSFLGLELDSARNAENAPRITSERSTIAGLVIEANEEIIVARETLEVIRNS